MEKRDSRTLDLRSLGMIRMDAVFRAKASKDNSNLMAFFRMVFTTYYISTYN
jgi:hypothetical protein